MDWLSDEDMPIDYEDDFEFDSDDSLERTRFFPNDSSFRRGAEISLPPDSTSATHHSSDSDLSNVEILEQILLHGSSALDPVRDRSDTAEIPLIRDHPTDSTSTNMPNIHDNTDNQDRRVSSPNLYSNPAVDGPGEEAYTPTWLSAAPNGIDSHFTFAPSPPRSPRGSSPRRHLSPRRYRPRSPSPRSASPSPDRSQDNNEDPSPPTRVSETIARPNTPEPPHSPSGLLSPQRDPIAPLYTSSWLTPHRHTPSARHTDMSSGHNTESLLGRQFSWQTVDEPLWMPHTPPVVTPSESDVYRDSILTSSPPSYRRRSPVHADSDNECYNGDRSEGEIQDTDVVANTDAAVPCLIRDVDVGSDNDWEVTFENMGLNTEEPSTEDSLTTVTALGDTATADDTLMDINYSSYQSLLQTLESLDTPYSVIQQTSLRLSDVSASSSEEEGETVPNILLPNEAPDGDSQYPDVRIVAHTIDIGESPALASLPTPVSPTSPISPGNEVETSQFDHPLSDTWIQSRLHTTQESDPDDVDDESTPITISTQADTTDNTLHISDIEEGESDCSLPDTSTHSSPRLQCSRELIPPTAQSMVISSNASVAAPILANVNLEGNPGRERITFEQLMNMDLSALGELADDEQGSDEEVAPAEDTFLHQWSWDVDNYTGSHSRRESSSWSTIDGNDSSSSDDGIIQGGNVSTQLRTGASVSVRRRAASVPTITRQSALDHPLMVSDTDSDIEPDDFEANRPDSMDEDEWRSVLEVIRADMSENRQRRRAERRALRESIAAAADDEVTTPELSSSPPLQDGMPPQYSQLAPHRSHSISVFTTPPTEIGPRAEGGAVAGPSGVGQGEVEDNEEPPPDYASLFTEPEDAAPPDYTSLQFQRIVMKPYIPGLAYKIFDQAKLIFVDHMFFPEEMSFYARSLKGHLRCWYMTSDTCAGEKLVTLTKHNHPLYPVSPLITT